MSDTVKILFIGATGYLGGTMYDRLLKLPQASRFEVTNYVRSEEKAKKCEAAGLKAISGPLSVLTEAATNSSVIFNVASSDNVPLNEAILEGAKKGYAKTKVPPVLIHTSGTAVVADNAMGKYASDKVYDDMDESLKEIPITGWHRNVDIPIAKAHDEGYVKAYIIAPPLIWGLATGRLVDAGLQNPVTSGLLVIGRIAISRGKFGYIGPQLNVWTTIEIHELADLHLKIFTDVFFENKNIAGGGNYYFAANGDVQSKEYLSRMVKPMYKYGMLKTDEVDQIRDEEFKKWPVMMAFAINSRVTDSRARSLGWQPTKTPEDFLKTIDENMRIMSKQSLDFGASWGSYQP